MNTYEITMFDVGGNKRVALLDATNVDAAREMLVQAFAEQNGLLIDNNGNLYPLSNMSLIKNPVLMSNNENV